MNKPPSMFYIEDEDGYPIFEVAVQPFDASCEFVVRSISTWNQDKTPYALEDYMALTVKWDGCSHYSVGEKDEDQNMYAERNGYLHLCGARMFKQHMYLLQFLYNRAYIEMGRAPEPGEELSTPDIQLLR